MDDQGSYSIRTLYLCRMKEAYPGLQSFFKYWPCSGISFSDAYFREICNRTLEAVNCRVVNCILAPFAWKYLVYAILTQNIVAWLTFVSRTCTYPLILIWYLVRQEVLGLTTNQTRRFYLLSIFNVMKIILNDMLRTIMFHSDTGFIKNTLLASNQFWKGSTSSHFVVTPNAFIEDPF